MLLQGKLAVQVYTCGCQGTAPELSVRLFFEGIYHWLKSWKYLVYHVNTMSKKVPLCMYLYMCVGTCAYMCMHMCVYMCTHIVCICKYLYVYIYICVHVLMYVYIPVTASPTFLPFNANRSIPFYLCPLFFSQRKRVLHYNWYLLCSARREIKCSWPINLVLTPWTLHL